MTARKLAFIVRPFGTKESIDFDRVECELIKPALKLAGGEGDTTGVIASAGNIREDMFEMLATRELCIADISIHNANVFYELGVRHALRGKRTFLIKAKSDKDVPFDLKTDRYLEYDANNPAASVAALAEGLKQTLNSDKNDSPVLKLLEMTQGIIFPELARLLAPPAGFHEEVGRASKEGRFGDLALLGEEAGLFPWEQEGLRVVGVEQFKHARWEDAKWTWEKVLRFDEKDLDANTRLGTVYQKRKEHAFAEAAINRVIAAPALRGPERAELGALLGSNVKTLWEDEWKAIADQAERERAALASPRLKASLDAYSNAFADDRNHFYPGLNALALLIIMLELGRRYPVVWDASYEGDEEPGAYRRKLERTRDQLLAAVPLGMESAQRVVDLTKKRDRWLEISRGDLELLRGGKVERIVAAYNKALVDAERFYVDSPNRQLGIFARLGVLPEAAAAAVKSFDDLYKKLPAGGSKAGCLVLVFTGHRVDAPGRAKPRFPRSKEAEKAARAMIADAVKTARAGVAKDATVIGISGGASGGDILFHEVCAEQGIKTEMFIIHSRETYVKASVQDAGPDWVARYDVLAKPEIRPVRYLGNSDEPLQHPRWLRPAETKYNIWQRSNRWILNNALSYGAASVTLIALWNGEGGDGAGGTEDMVKTATDRGATVRILDAKPLVRMA